MKLRISELRSLIRGELTLEAAITHASISSKCALVGRRDGNSLDWQTVILYDADRLEAALSSNETQSRDDLLQEIRWSVLGFIRTALACRHPRIRKVTQSWAQNRYGPFVYDVAMSHSPLTSDDTVSDSARNVWKYYDENRADVIKVPVPWEREHKLAHLTTAFQLKAPIDTSQLESRHDAVCKQLEAHDISNADFIRTIRIQVDEVI